jgi:queuine tRNA-ribosyltransferase
MKNFEYQVSKEGFRIGKVHTPHGTIDTPEYMPVGTQGSVKTMSPDEMVTVGAQVILGNTYHLNLRPGADIIKRAGGLHGFISWNRPILTDSGGFQVFSLAQRRTVLEHGVEFQSHIDGAYCFLGPKEVMDIQSALGSDIWMVLDECPPWPCEEAPVRSAVERSLRWAQECLEHKKRQGENDPAYSSRLLFGIVQGGSHVHLRKECAQRLVDLGFDGYAVGGVSVGEPEDEMMLAIESAVPWLPQDKPRYAMGLGTPRQMVEMVARGIDMFDCVLPTRIARNGVAYTNTGYLQVGAGRFKEDFSPIMEGCACYACRNFSRAYIRHLLNAGEVLGLRLVSWHNLHFYLDLMRQVRTAIREERFQEFRTKFCSGYKEPNDQDRQDAAASQKLSFGPTKKWSSPNH